MKYYHFKYLAFCLIFFTQNAAMAQSASATEGSMAQRASNVKINFDSLPRPEKWVTDFDHVFTAEELTGLEYTLSHFERESTIEICLVTVDSISITKAGLDSLTIRLFEKWQLGKADKDNGILMIYSKGHKAIRVAKGSGIDELIAEEDFQSIIDRYFVPGFSTGQYYKTLNNGVSQLIGMLSK